MTMRSMTMPRQGVYAVTDPTLLAGNRLIPAVEQAIRGGVRLVQYRNKSADEQQRLQEVRALLTLCRAAGVPLLINDSIDLCLEAEADGVHLGQQDGDLQEARRRLGTEAIIGITCHNNAQFALQAQARGASYIAMGRFFHSETKPQAVGASIAELRQIRALLGIPIVAIGGINAENGASLLEAGANMLAAIHYLFATPDVYARAVALDKLFQRYA